MKRYAKIATACLAIVALTIDSVTAGWFFARRTRCRPCPPRCYSAPVVCEGFSFVPMPPQPIPRADGAGTAPSGAEMPPAPSPTEPRPTLTPPDPGLETSPSDRGNGGRLDPLPDREQPLPETEPMPEPPADATETAPPALDNPFSQPRDTEPPAAAEEAPPALDDPIRPTPGATELDNPFGPRPGATETAPPTVTPPESAPAPSTDNPFAPRDSAPPGPAEGSNPFAPQSGAGASPDAPTSSSAQPAADGLLVPRSTDAQPPADNPFAPRPADAGSTADDPFRLPSDAASQPMSEVNEAPMNGATDATKEAPPASDSTDEPALENPFAEPAPDRLSAVGRATKSADAMRVWTDITGEYQVRGRLNRILVAEQKVRILKETGKYTTVPFSRLSESDRTFVAHHAIGPSSLLAENR